MVVRDYTSAMHIVVVEDNRLLASSIREVLMQEGYTVTHFDNGRLAYAWLSTNIDTYDLVILDVLLPELDGFTLCRKLRNDMISRPILMLTSKGALEDIIEGLDEGADDYLKKPFVFDELLARVRTLLRRLPQLLATEIAITPDVQIDLGSRKVFKQRRKVHLTAKEFGILVFFLRNPNVLLTQQQLYDHVFDAAEVQLSNTIEVHIKNLRKKLRTKKFELPITTVRNAGYRFDYGK